MRKVEVAAVHRSACWDDVEEMRQNSIHMPPAVVGPDGGHRGSRPEAGRTEIAVFMMCEGRWPQRLLRPMLDSIIVDSSSDRKNTHPEAMAIVCDKSTERLQLEIRLLDLQCSHVCSEKANHAIGSERDREKLRNVVDRWGTLHWAGDRGTKSGRVLLPARFSERLLVLSALIRARSDTASLGATPGPWLHQLVQKGVEGMLQLCKINAEMGLVEWLDEAASFAEYGLHAHHFSDPSDPGVVFFDASTFDACLRYGPGAAERLVGSMARLGIISMQVLCYSFKHLLWCIPLLLARKSNRQALISFCCYMLDPAAFAGCLVAQ